MQTSILRVHGVVTFCMALVTLVVFARLLIGIARKQAYGQLTHWLMLAFSGINTLQWAVGGLVLITLGNFTNLAFWSHAVTMTTAVVVSYLPLRWRKSADAVRYRRAVLVVKAVLVLVVVGLLFLAGGHKKQPK